MIQLMMAFMHILVHRLKNSGGAHASAYAHGHHTVFRVPAGHLAQKSGGEFGTGAAERMAKGDSSTIDIDSRGVETEHFDDGERLSGEGFVKFDDSYVFQ